MSPVEANILNAAITQAVLPIIVSLLIRCDWPREVKILVAILLSLAGSWLSAYAAGNLNGVSFTVGALIIIPLAQANFKSWFKVMGFDDIFENIPLLPAWTQPVQDD